MKLIRRYLGSLRVLSAVMVSIVAAAACGGVVGEGPVLQGGESHFLRSCDGSCGDGLSCIAGVCTEICLVGDSICSALEVLAVCTDQSVEPGRVAVCDVACGGNAECASLGADYTCEYGFCRAPQAGAGGVLGTSGSGGASGAGGSSITGGSGTGGAPGGGGTYGSAAGGSTGAGTEPTSSRDVPAELEQFTLKIFGGFGPLAPPGSNCEPARDGVTYQVNIQTRAFAWSMCGADDAGEWRKVQSQRTLSEAELGDVLALIDQLETDSPVIPCSDARSAATFDVARLDGVIEQFADAFNSGCPLLEGRTFVTGLSDVGITLDSLR
jgi:hypothetical protein